MEPPRGYTHDQNFVMPEAKEPPTQPATPPSQRAIVRNRLREQEIRAQALGLAVLRANAFHDTLPEEVFIAADEFVAYIEDGKKP